MVDVDLTARLTGSLSSPAGAVTALAVLLAALVLGSGRVRSWLFSTRSSSEIRISQLKLYPIKSVRGVSVPKAKLTQGGLEHDREFALALRSDESGTYDRWTLFEEANVSLALCSSFADAVRLTGILQLGRFIVEKMTDDELIVGVLPKFASADPAVPRTLSVSLAPLPPPSAASPLVTFQIGTSNAATVRDIGDEASAFFAAHLGDTVPAGQRVRLVRKLYGGEGVAARELTGCGEHIKGRDLSLQNVLPLLLVNEASWEDLRSQMAEEDRGDGDGFGAQMTIDRTRGNVVLSGARAWEEDEYARVRITPTTSEHSADDQSSSETRATTELDVVGRCMRCKILTVDPVTGERHATEPLKTMMKTRRIDQGAPYKAAFGMHAVPVPPFGATLRVGDKVDVLATTRKHFYIKGY